MTNEMQRLDSLSHLGPSMAWDVLDGLDSLCREGARESREIAEADPEAHYNDGCRMATEYERDFWASTVVSSMLARVGLNWVDHGPLQLTHEEERRLTAAEAAEYRSALSETLLSKMSPHRFAAITASLRASHQ